MKQVQDVRVTSADPSGIGLFGLAIVTLVASTQKLGWTEGLGFVLPWAIFLGGFAQIYASILDAKIGNTFGATAFGAYGFFWLAVGGGWLVQAGVFGEVLAAQTDIHQLGVVYLGFLAFTVFMTIGALETNKVLFLIFFLINFLFLGLGLSSLGIMETFMHNVAAYSELLIGMLSIYGAGVNVLNRHFGFEFLPLGKPFNIIGKQRAKAKSSSAVTH
ncbi:transcriptional regulator [Kurthia zopfii]|uniref:Inner membrane protein yaaH n=1 Tax=Kurthia zopfii TaxID=1650 RepID=A0A2U3AAK2_9BACL|nr:GPR1/FUN34/YaaH family transporter [Kurthia zopfii]PWI21566.1 hypothetical protein DF281_11680 [Kurthia zopfii]TDR34995.1 transcriptional regulator [Kurthia zopfii]STX09615.1 Inner membrane protein yaaH [Kurthia zopfii]VEI08284.1 Inner membrane protein yaaH [Kurthia zopfii]GEK31464.1 transcriptional regulator [Kurthia zopfii]